MKSKPQRKPYTRTKKQKPPPTDLLALTLLLLLIIPRPLLAQSSQTTASNPQETYESKPKTKSTNTTSFFRSRPKKAPIALRGLPNHSIIPQQLLEVQRQPQQSHRIPVLSRNQETQKSVQNLKKELREALSGQHQQQLHP